MAPTPTKHFPAESLETRLYGLVEKYKEYVPRMNDRNRLGYNLYKFMTGEGDPPLVIVKNNKLVLQGITEEELAAKFEEDLKEIKTAEANPAE
ncbi:MAG: hypothetical protein GXO87_12995 [Chlorobi bacterium]|nr:hypothetical protein [Chlorobiota bacterium]